MRKLSKYEKDLVRRIISLTNDSSKVCTFTNISTIKLTTTKQNRVHYDINPKTQKSTKTIDRQYEFRIIVGNEYQDLVALFNDLYNKLISTVNLLKYLEENGYLYIGEEIETKYPSEFPQDNKQFHKIQDSHLIGRLVYYTEHRLIATEPLIQYVKNGFKTDEEKSNKILIVVNYVLIGFSLISMILSFITSYQSFTDEKNFSIKGTVKVESIPQTKIVDTIQVEFKAIKPSITDTLKRPGNNIKK